jgi:hypothetical protein
MTCGSRPLHAYFGCAGSNLNQRASARRGVCRATSSSPTAPSWRRGPNRGLSCYAPLSTGASAGLQWRSIRESDGRDLGQSALRVQAGKMPRHMWLENAYFLLNDFLNGII